MNKEVTFGNLITIAVILVGGIIAVHVRISISEERNNNQDKEIDNNKTLIKDNQNKTEAKLDKIIDLIIDSKDDK